MKTKRALVVLLTLLLAGHLNAATNAPEWKAGVAKVVITPDQPMWMAGYAARTNVSQGKATELYGKALALEDAHGTRLVIVPLDLIRVPRALRNGVEAAVLKEHNLPREALLMNCSHTHSGPEFGMGTVPRSWPMFDREAVAGCPLA